MSTWRKLKKDDIDIDFDNNEVDLYVCGDDWGNVYLTLSFEQIKEIASKIDKEEPKP